MVVVDVLLCLEDSVGPSAGAPGLPHGYLDCLLSH